MPLVVSFGSALRTALRLGWPLVGFSQARQLCLHVPPGRPETLIKRNVRLNARRQTNSSPLVQVPMCLRRLRDKGVKPHKAIQSPKPPNVPATAVIKTPKGIFG